MRSDFAAVLTAAFLLDSFWRNNGEPASVAPCRPGFSQSFYSVLISRDVLQGQGILKGATLASQTVKFDDCMGNEAVVFQSSDPVFSVRTDGSVYAREEGASLDEPVRFKLTASGPHTHAWEAVVQLSLTSSPSAQQNEDEIQAKASGGP